MTDSLRALNCKKREMIIKSYEARISENEVDYMENKPFATKEYIYENQKLDANIIVNEFYTNNYRAISISKKTKVGMDGLMIEIIKLMTTHPDDDFIIDIKNVRILTGMSNVSWQHELEKRCPEKFRSCVFHHGQIQKSDLCNLKNALIIIDEIDSGSEVGQVLDRTLKNTGLLNLDNMINNNIRFIFASATNIKQLYDLYRWGKKYHMWYKMTIPSSYIGHIDFLNSGVLKESYSLCEEEKAEEWIKEDIINYYGSEYRIHLVRVTETKSNSRDVIEKVCDKYRIRYHIHTSSERISKNELDKIFEEPLTRHCVIMIKGFYRRADFIPNQWKLKIGAVHELYTVTVDDNVQMQGLIGRMSGYWREYVERGHKIGPYRMATKSVENYEKIFNDPFGKNSFQSSNFNKKNGKVTKNMVGLLTPCNVVGVQDCGLPESELEQKWDLTEYEFKSIREALDFFKKNGIRLRKFHLNDECFVEGSTTKYKGVLSYDKVKEEMKNWSKLSNFDIRNSSTTPMYTRCYPCYKDVGDCTSIVIICRVLKLKKKKVSRIVVE